MPRNLLISSGDGAKSHPGGQLAISVRVTDATGASIAGALVNFTVTAGDAKLRPAAVQTGIDGIATSQVTLGEVLGTITIRADSSGLTPVVFSLVNEAEVLILPAPVISDVIGYPQSTPPSRILTKNGLVVILGDNLSPNPVAKPVTAADLAAGQLPTTFNGSCVDIGGALAPLLSVSSKQIVFQAPNLAAAAAANVKVLSGCGTVREVASDASSVAVRALAPEFFYAQRNASGGNRVSVLSLASGAPVKTVKPGDDIILYLTGLGATDPAYEPGQIVGDNALVSAQVQVLLNGNVLSTDNVLYVGTTAEYPGEDFVPGISQNAGIYQIRILVPSDAPDGDMSIQVVAGDQASPDGAVLTVQSTSAASQLLRLRPEKAAASDGKGKSTRPR